MNLTIRKSAEQQAQLTPATKLARLIQKRLPFLNILIFTGIICLASGTSEADIYRFVTVDGVETFTDIPSDKKATLVIKSAPATTGKQRKSAKKQKTHDISLDEIVQKAVSAAITPPEADQNSFQHSLPTSGGTVTSRVGMRIDPIDGKWRQHNGIDVAIPTGTPIRPIAPGIVVYRGNRPGYGYTVIVEHDNGIVSLYAHNSKILVTEGQQVATDSTLALSGSSGRSTGPHLHFEAWQSGTNVSEAFLPDSGVTLPKTTLAAVNNRPARFRSETLSDGSILFTNIPQSTP